MMHLLELIPYCIIFAAAFYLYGHYVLDRLVRSSSGRWEYFVLSSTLGMGIVAWAVYVLGVFGFLSPLSVLIVLVIPSIVPALKGTKLQIRKRFWAGVSWSAWGFLLVCGFLFVLSISPLIGNDALCYHMYLAKEFATQHRIATIPYNVNSDWPLLYETLYSAAFQLSGSALAKLNHGYAAVLIALSLVGFLEKTPFKAIGWLAALIFMLTPLIVNLAGTAYIDIGFALFCWIAFICFLRWTEDSKPVWAALTGVFLGFALGVKFLALFALAAIGAAFILNLFRDRELRRRGFTASMIVLITLLIVGGFWYFKLWHQYGNPFYPYFDPWFGGSIDPLKHHYNPIPKTFLGILTAPIYVTFAPERFGGFGEQVGVIYMLLVPFAFCLRGIRRVSALAIYAAAYFILWALFYQNLRFLTPIIPALALLSAYGIFGASQKAQLNVKYFQRLVAAILLFQAALAVYHYRDELKNVMGLMSEREYLTRKERVFGVATYMNETYGRKAKIFMPNEILFYRFDAETVRGNYMMQENPTIFKQGNFSEAVNFLKAQQISHILIADKGLERESFLRALTQLTGAELASYGLVAERVESNSEGGDYRLYRLTSA